MTHCGQPKSAGGPVDGGRSLKIRELEEEGYQTYGKLTFGPWGGNRWEKWWLRRKKCLPADAYIYREQNFQTPIRKHRKSPECGANGMYQPMRILLYSSRTGEHSLSYSSSYSFLKLAPSFPAMIAALLTLFQRCGWTFTGRLLCGTQNLVHFWCTTGAPRRITYILILEWWYLHATWSVHEVRIAFEAMCPMSQRELMFRAKRNSFRVH